MVVRALSAAPAEHQQDLSYLLASLKADPRATAIAPNLEATSGALKTKTEDWTAKHFAVRETQNGLGIADENLINVVRTAHSVILDDVRHNHHSQRFLTYFPRGLVAFTRASYLDRLTAVRSLAQRCAQDPSPKVQAQAGILEAAADQMDAAFAHRAEALVAESSSFGELQVQKLQAIDTCRRVGYRLAELYPEERDRVRSYFRQTYRRPRPTVPAAGEPAAAATTAATGTATMETATTGTAPKATPTRPSLVPAPTEASL